MHVSVFLSLSSPRRGSGGRTLQTAISYSQIHQQWVEGKPDFSHYQLQCLPNKH